MQKSSIFLKKSHSYVQKCPVRRQKIVNTCKEFVCVFTCTDTQKLHVRYTKKNLAIVHDGVDS